MKELSKTFEGKGQVKGYTFNQISATQYGYLYAVLSNGEVNHYEVFKRVENDRFGVVSYPSNKAFGKWAWTTKNLVRANNILKGIEKREIEKLTA